MLMQILFPVILPCLHIVTLLTVPATAVYAFLGLLSTPITVPLLIVLRAIKFALFSPLLLLTLPLSVPIGGALAFCCTVHHVVCSLFTVFTPLLWPLSFLCKWYRYTCLVSQVMVTDTIAPWLVPLRFTFLAALFHKAAMFK